MQSILRYLVSVFAIAACGGGQTTTTTTNTTGSANAYHCTPKAGASADAENAACATSPDHCSYGPVLTCVGTPPPPQVQEADRKARADGTIACACVCQAEREACNTVP